MTNLVIPKKWDTLFFGAVSGAYAYALATPTGKDTVTAIMPYCFCWDFLSKVMASFAADSKFDIGHGNFTSIPLDRDKTRFLLYTKTWEQHRSEPELLPQNYVKKFMSIIDTNLVHLNEYESSIGFEPTVITEESPKLIEADGRWLKNSLLFHTYKLLIREALTKEYETYGKFISAVCGGPHFYGHPVKRVKAYLDVMPRLAKNTYKTWTGYSMDQTVAYATRSGPACLFPSSYSFALNPENYRSKVIVDKWPFIHEKYKPSFPNTIHETLRELIPE